MKKLGLVVQLALLVILVSWPLRARSEESALTLLAPSGGAALESGVTYTLQWDASPDMVGFRLTYSVDRGLTWITIGDATSALSNDWTTPVVEGEGGTCIVKVAGFDVNEDMVGEALSEVFLAGVPYQD